MTDKHLTQSPEGEFVMFASGDGKVRVECRFESDTLWLSQAMLVLSVRKRQMKKRRPNTSSLLSNNGV